MIHFAVFLFAAMFLLACVGGTFSAIGAAFEEGPGWGLFVLAVAGLVWGGLFIAFVV